MSYNVWYITRLNCKFKANVEPAKALAYSLSAGLSGECVWHGWGLGWSWPRHVTRCPLRRRGREGARAAVMDGHKKWALKWYFDTRCLKHNKYPPVLDLERSLSSGQWNEYGKCSQRFPSRPIQPTNLKYAYSLCTGCKRRVRRGVLSMCATEGESNEQWKLQICCTCRMIFQSPT